MRRAQARVCRASKRFRHGAAVWLVLGLVCVLPRIAAADPPQWRVDLDALLERQDLRARGLLLEFGVSLRVPIDPTQSATLRRETHYSPTSHLVFDVSGPGYLPAPPEYYLYDGAYYVYTPRDYSTPALRITAAPRSVHQDILLRNTDRKLREGMHGRTLGSGTEGGAGQGFTVQVIKELPGPLSTMFGRDATTIRITGRESISFAGESRRVQPYIASEQGRGQSFFPRLDMDQDLQVKLEGNIGGKVHVAVDHNSSVFGADANRVNVWYEGYEDDIVRRIDLGGTNLTLPGSRLVAPAGLSQGVFGVKTDMRLAGLDLTLLAAKEETEAETRTLTPSGGSASTFPIEENRYVRDRFFFYELPDTSSIDLYYSYGLAPGSLDAQNQPVPGQLIDQNLLQYFHVFIDDRNPATEDRRPFFGYAVADLAPALTTVEMDAAYNATSNAARWPIQEAGVNFGDPNFRIAKWRRMTEEEIGWVLFDANGQKLVLGFYLRNGPLGDSQALGVSIRDPRSREVGNIDEAAPPTVRLRLVRHPEQDSDFARHPTAPLMMRHVYQLTSTSIQDLELSIESRSAGNQLPNVPQRLPQSTYLHMFGLDELNQANRPFPDGGPDGLFDSHRANLVDRENGFLFMPGLRPFSPPPEIVTARLITAGVSEDSALTFREELFGASETVKPTMYTLPKNDQTIPANEYQLLVRTSGTETEITLPQDILQDSDVVRLDGRTLTRGVDYDIEPVAGGKITFKGPVLNEISPSSRIEVSYAFRPLLGTGQATLLGASGKYSFGNRGYLASVWLWESRRSFARQPQIGDEPSQNLVGDVNMSLRFLPGWMTRLADLLPFTRTNAGSSITMTAEAALSMPNPNTKNNAFVEDMESADTSDRVSSGREAWSWASLPDPAATLADTVNRIPTAFYNPFNRVKRGHLNPTLPETEANDGITVLELGFDRQSMTNLLTSEPFRAPFLWSGVMSAFAGNGFDLTQARTLEFWVNDGIGEPALRRGRMHIDFGDISEDFVFFKNNPDRLLDDNTSFNREAVNEFQFIPTEDDLGWNGRDDNCPGEDTPWPIGVDCHLPSRINTDGQNAWANGTEGDNRYDTEDINGDGEWDTKNSFFRYTLELADVSLVDPGTDITPTYGNDPSVDPDLRPGFQGWRHYRLDLQKILLDSIVAPGQTPPSLRQIRYLRIWFEDPTAPPEPENQLWTKNFQIHDFKFTGSQWLQLGVFGVDSTRVEPAVDESFSVSVINNKESPEYTIPPDADLIDTAGVQAREQALRLTFSQLRPGHEMVTQKTNPQGRPTDYTLYQRMNFFTNYRGGSLDSVEVFFRMGTDSLNFYEVARAVQGGSEWQETVFDLRSLTDLKFPEDVGAPVDTLFLGGRDVVQVTRTLPDANNPAFTLRLTRRGNPSLKQVGRLFVGVRHLRPATDTTALPVSGELWFNNVRVEDVKREVGTAQLYAVQGNFADVFDFSSQLSMRDAEFLGLRQRTGSGSETVSFNTSLKVPDAARLIPTLGFTIPLSYSMARDISRPKFSTASDTENDATRAEEQRNESVRVGYSFSVSKKPSRLFLFKPTLDRTVFSYNESRTQNRSFTTRDTSVSWSQSLNYDLSPRARNLPFFFKQQLNFLPTNIKFGLRHQNGRRVDYTVPNTTTGLLVPKPPSGVRSLDLNASVAVRPMQILNAHYNFAESRDYREAAPENEEERFSLAGFDFGLPTGRSEQLSVDLNPRFFQYSYTSSYGDRRTLQIDQSTGLPRPDLHQVTNGRTHRFSFDFKLHRRLAKLAGAPTQPGLRPPPPVPQGSEPPPGGDEDSPPRGDEDSPPRGDEDVPGGGEAPAPGAGEPPVVTPPPAGTTAPADSVRESGQKRFPNPVKTLVRFVGSIEPVKVEWNDTRSASHVGLPYGGTAPFRYGFSTDSGVIGFSDPSPLNNTMGLNLSSAIPLRGALRITARYGLRDTDIETRSGRDSLLRVNINSARETTFPGLEFSVNDLQKLRIFSSRLQRSTLTLGFVRTTSDRINRDYDQSGNPPKETNKRQSENLTLTANWTGAWKGTTATTLGFNQTSGEESETGQRTTNKRRSITGTLRFKLSPKGGIKLPWIGALKTGVDVLFNGSYNTDEGFLFNDPNDPSRSIPQRQTSAIAGGVRGDYTLARNMTGGLELGYTRNRDNKNNQTVSTIRLGFNLTFLF